MYSRKVGPTPLRLPLLLLLLRAGRGSAYTSAELAAMPRGGAPCEASDAFACFGNGECATGRCRCDAAWTGANCTTLDLAPAPANGAIRRSGWSTWGGSPIRADGKIHVFASQMANHCPLGTWQNNSLVVHAIADKIAGPYELQPELVLPPFHHNPSVQRAPDGTYLIYCIGSRAGACPDGPSSNCTGETIKHCPPPDAQLAATQPLTPLEMTAERAATAVGGLDGSVHLAHAKSLSGPWTLQPADQPVLAGRQGRWDEQSTNPAPHVLKNGTALLVYRGINGFGTDRIGAAKASKWSGPYTRVVDEPLFGRCGNWTSSRSSSTVPADTGCSPVHNWTKLLNRTGQPEWGAICDECIGWAEDPFLYTSSRGPYTAAPCVLASKRLSPH